MIGDKITQFASLDSTNNYVAKQLLTGDYTPGEVILAHFQTEGRGRRGNAWQSQPGENLTFSFAVATDFIPNHQNFVLSKAVSTGIYDFLKAVLTADICIKWPNDILVSGKKICGILIEQKMINSTRQSVVGIGLNVNQTDFPDHLKATSLALELTHKITTYGLMPKFLQALNANFELLLKNDFDAVDRKYFAHLYGTDHWVEFDDSIRQFNGQIRGVGNDGVLQVRSRQGRWLSYRTNEVRIRY